MYRQSTITDEAWAMRTITDPRPRGVDIAAGKDESCGEIAAIAKVLGHPARIQIVRLLLEKEWCFGCDMVDEVKLAQSTVSEHLRILTSAGIIAGDIEHPRVWTSRCRGRRCFCRSCSTSSFR
jgi:hypothetical protein